MNMPPRVRKLALTAHVASSVGWLGAVAAFLALAVFGLTSPDAETVGSAYVATELITWTVIVPLAAASLLTGLVQALGTPWGLFRHYWVLIKFLLSVLASALLLLHTQPIGYVADLARTTLLSPTDLRPVRIQLVADAGAALVVLLVVTALSVYKPRGMTPYGWRKDRAALQAGLPRARGVNGASSCREYGADRVAQSRYKPDTAIQEPQ